MKRSSAYQRSAGLCKRRAPYTSRACDACRRRKGKCDGQQPCDFCAAREQECIYNGITSDYWSAQHMSAPSTTSHRTGEATAALTLGHESVAQVVLQMKNQLDSLSRRVESQAATFATATRQNEDRRDRSCLVLPRESVLNGHQRRSLEQKSVMATQCFYGPTSPDYSLNIAQIRVRQPDSSSDVVYHKQLQLASIDNEPAIADGTTDEREATESPTPAAVGERCIPMHLIGFRALINYREALRLLASFQDIVGDFHPFVNLDSLVARTRAWYVGSPSLELQQFGSDRTARLSLEEDLITYNLVLAIALHADAEPRSSDIESIIWNNCKETVNSRLTSRTTGMQHVIIVLLKAWYEFVNDMPQAAWRTCGIAGRMLMELGFHDYQVLTRLVTSERQRTEASNLLCSITVLDRQWSASTGLPANFDANSFDASLKTKIENPYLKAMMSFILISDKFHEPISRAAKGGKYPDDDSFEVLDFQIEQWRKRAVGHYSFCNTSEWVTDLTKRPPSWAIILHLRAESIRSLLLRPFFFTHADTASSKRHLRSAVELSLSEAPSLLPARVGIIHRALLPASCNYATEYRNHTELSLAGPEEGLLP
ncbi:hypothetical protein FNYG_01063 [Fusarium nygamai]|uniref:Zn(2)-C6 fungal-type domain-containing protein n=1 Tax=Gibberella nygamai TaxID=42673 RepID=A0A2K0WUR3_GIBNY|nr:hypothetical protein FNYG_01063 [Fusarium nygamai]